MNSLDVVILAAGQGTRMRSRMPKVLHELAGKALLQHVVDTANALSPAGIHVVYGHGGDQVKAKFEGQAVTWAEQAEQLGTGHAVAQATPAISDDSVVLILYGDVPLVVVDTLQAAIEPAMSGDVGLVTMVLDDATGYGRIVRDDSGNVVAIVEQKDATPEQQAIREGNTGIMAAPAGKLKAWLGQMSNDNAQGEYYLTDVIEMATRDGIAVKAIQAGAVEEVAGVNDRRQLSELERWYQLREAQRLMAEGATLADPERVDVRGHLTVGRDVFIDINTVFEGNVTLADGVRIGPNCVVRDASIGEESVIHPNSVIDSAEVGPGCLIGPFARLRPGAVLEEAVHIGNYVEVKNTRVGVGSKANHLTYLGDAEIGTGVNVGAGTITCNYDGANKHRTVIGDRAFIGSGVELVAPIVVHEGATVGAGTTLGSDAPAEQLTVARAKARSIAGWKRPVKKPKK